ncbi:MAG: 50S ribosomal protein L11 methyltransferase [Alistipes sp.]|nr:50S ribosomal protein L11 methyltransferase [Alistipes sp.]MBO7307284.1 50S ribosomal protein L11 methyltransferase [Alistipes sp.]
MKQYIELRIFCPSEEMADIATAYLADYDFESFDTTVEAEGVTLCAYRTANDWQSCCDEAMAAIAEFGKITSVSEIEDENWNSAWEAEGFQPVDIDGCMMIRAPHHPAPTNPSTLDIIVSPSMSFGSGHHHTTRMMCRHILDCKNSGEALDVGCGTGVLSIAALKCGAKRVDAVDIDIWSTESAREAAVLNGISDKMDIILGTVEAIEGRTYDMVMANINRNIILSDIARYAAALNPGGTLLLSGFLLSDRDDIIAAARNHNISLVAELNEEEWVALKLTKQP